MLRYYSYYSVGGYKDFILGTSEDKQEATCLFCLSWKNVQRQMKMQQSYLTNKKIFLKYNSCQLSSHSTSQHQHEYFSRMPDINFSTNILKEIIMLWL